MGSVTGLTKQQEADFTWFLENRKFLFEKYGYSFIVIENKIVIKVYEGFDDAVELKALDEMYKIKEAGTYIVQGLTEDENYYGAVRCANYFI
ncbi:MAG: hypothetical protein IJ661_10470 [Lachnospiraceae bacterium]|nr:hypothetical protein [Lachnospiraceae bacterium]